MEESVSIVGVMSGTSLDGLDMALCRFYRIHQEDWQYSIDLVKTVSFPLPLKEKLATAMTKSALEFVKLDIEFGEFIGDQINHFLKTMGSLPHYIASHGHTVFHQPNQGYTTQIGNGAVIAARTGLTTISDFRSTDVALGGQGAPLVPVGDALLFSEYGACLNLGGFSNISYQQDGNRIAFDISPCNLPLNLLAMQMGFEYDAYGRIASLGSVSPSLLSSLNALPFYSELPPKSLGMEWLKEQFYPVLNAENLSIEDKMRTVTEHIALQIVRTSNKISGKTILITGGGVKNDFLRRRIQELSEKKIIIPDIATIDYKEALIFAFLGLLRVKDQNNCYASVTGAASDSCGGNIYIGRTK